MLYYLYSSNAIKNKNLISTLDIDIINIFYIIRARIENCDIRIF